jgi:hypothetical protein
LRHKEVSLGHPQLLATSGVFGEILTLHEGSFHLVDIVDGAGLDGIQRRAEDSAALEGLLRVGV